MCGLRHCPGDMLALIMSHHCSCERDMMSCVKLLLSVRKVVDDVQCLCCVVQHECIPQAILGMDVVCQAKSGMGKTAVFVLATLQQLEPVSGQVLGRSVFFIYVLLLKICLHSVLTLLGARKSTQRVQN